MIIKSLELADFRNYEELKIEFSSGTNILYGDNAQGKTNILEAIFLSATTKSHKGSKDREIIRFGQEEAHIRTILEKDGAEYRLDMLNKLYKHTQLQDSFGIIMLSLVNNEPKILSLTEMLKYYIQHQEEVVTRRTRYDLNKAEERNHILEGLLIALDNIDEVIKIIRGSANVQVAKEQLMARFGLSDAQSQAIVDMRLRTLTGLERDKIEQEHASMRYAAPVRKEMGARTIFNILGPLANPAGAKMQLMGVYDKKLVEPLAQVLSNLGVVRGVAVCGCDGIDEVTLSGPTCVCEIRNGELSSYEITPEQFGLKRCELKDLLGGDPEQNAQITKDILSGKEKGPKREVVVINAAVAMYLGIDGVSIADCIKKAEEILDSKKAYEKMEAFVRATNFFGEKK